MQIQAKTTQLYLLCCPLPLGIEGDWKLWASIQGDQEKRKSRHFADFAINTSHHRIAYISWNELDTDPASHMWSSVKIRFGQTSLQQVPGMLFLPGTKGLISPNINQSQVSLWCLGVFVFWHSYLPLSLVYILPQGWEPVILQILLPASCTTGEIGWEEMLKTAI